MNIVGMGIDLVDVARFQQAATRWGNRFLTRLFTPEELAYANQHRFPMPHLAARFAAKEALVKALGAPKGLGLEWQDVTILRNDAGKPEAKLKGTMQRWAHLRVHLSLTHTNRHAIATALVTE